MMDAVTRPAAVLVTCPHCEETVPGAALGGHGWMVDEVPEPLDVTCRVCGGSSRITAPWHTPGVYPALDLAVTLRQQVAALGLAVAPRRHEVELSAIRRPIGYEAGAGDAWAVWWQDAEGELHELLVIGDITAGPLVCGDVPRELSTIGEAQGWRIQPQETGCM